MGGPQQQQTSAGAQYVSSLGTDEGKEGLQAKKNKTPRPNTF